MSEVTTAPVVEVARAFFDACETGKGWDGCRQFCTSDATFSAQAEPLEDIHTLEGYTDWMKGLLTLLSDAGYELKSFAEDEGRGSVMAYAVFRGTHTGEGGPVPPTGKTAHADYVYVMDFEAGRIRHMTKIWNSGITLQQLGWAQGRARQGARGEGVRWPVTLAAWERHACAVAGRNLTREEWSRFVSGYTYTRVCP